MLQRIIDLYESATDDKVRLLTTLDDRVDAKHQSIKLYLTNLAARSLTHDEALRCQELLGACVKLEQVGDIIVGNMLAHARKRNARALQFTQEGWKKLLDFTALYLPTRGPPLTSWSPATWNLPASLWKRRIAFAIWRNPPTRAISNACAKERQRASRRARSTSTPSGI
ncbi:hypothetical protein ABIA16_004541 [Sinorhizobium fredii]